jgi:hypothetical protein
MVKKFELEPDSWFLIIVIKSRGEQEEKEEDGDL